MGCSDCVTQIDTCITHGTTFSQDVELRTGFDDAVAQGYQGRMSILDYEGGAVLDTIISPISVDNWMTFTLTPPETGALPRYDLWYQVELFNLTDVQRIYQGGVTMNL